MKLRKGRIESICKTIWCGKLKYEVRLAPNYSFSSTGNQVQYVDNIKELYELTKEIVFCDGVRIVC